jgi:hypothetical protein
MTNAKVDELFLGDLSMLMALNLLQLRKRLWNERCAPQSTPISYSEQVG